MAANLVANPNTTQTFVDDLESIFWVVLWIVLTQVQVSWSDEYRSSFIEGTMNPKVYSHCGGRAKKIFLKSDDALSEEEFEIIGNPTLRDLLEGLHSLIGARYRIPPSKKNKPFLPDNIASGAKSMSPEALEEATETYKRQFNHLKDHTMILRQFKAALAYEWPPSDKAKPQRLMASNSVIYSSSSGSKRSREVAEGNGLFNLLSSSKRQG